VKTVVVEEGEKKEEKRAIIISKFRRLYS